MEPKFLDRFTHEGRLKTQLLQAATDNNPTDRLAKLRPVRQQLKENPAKYPQLWILFLNVLLQADSVQFLTENDFKEFEEIGVSLLQTAKDGNTTGTLWSLLANAYELRGEAQNACRLFTRIYQTPFLDFRWKSHSIRELAKRGLRSDDYISMYSNYIRQAPEPMQEVDVLGMLTAYCSVTFSSATEQIEKAGELARQLLTDNIMLPCSYTTLGLYSLLIKKDAVDAASYFEKAFNIDMSNELALIGLFSAWIQDGNYENVDHFVRSQRSPLCNKPLIQAFSQFGTLLCWLESYAIGGAPPLTTNELLQFARLDLQQYVGDIFITACARLHLVEGNVREALVLLQSHIQKYPEQPRWHYYAAWAEMQLGEREALCDRYHSLVDKKGTSGKQECSRKSWPGCWTIACLLLDTDPSLDEKYGLQLYLRETARTFPQYASVIRTRLDLASATYPLPFTWKQGSGIFEEDLEALRTSLGHALYTRNYARLKRYTRHSLFTHLPVADQKMWTGVMLLMAGDRESTKKQGPENGARPSSAQINSTDTIEQGRKLLEDVAHHYNYQRAVLILAVHYLECGLLSRAKRMLHSFITATGRADAKIQLLKRYIDRVERNTVADIGKSVQQSDLAARAYYAQGCLYLSEARYESAARAFDTALTTPHISLPENCYAFMQCAQFLAAPDIYDDIWHDIKQLSSKEQKPFLVWCAFLVRLWYASPADILALWPNTSALFDHLDNLAEETRIVIAQAITRACQRATSQEQVNVLMHMLSKIIAAHAHPMLKRLQNISIASVAYKQYLEGNDHNRVHDYLDQQLQAYPSNSLLIFSLALTYLERQDTPTAIYVLNKAYLTTMPELHFCRFFVALLKGQLWDAVHFPLLLTEVIQRNTQCAQLVDTLHLFASGDPAEICSLIFRAWRSDQPEILHCIHVSSLLPYLCAHAMKTKVILPQLVDLVQQKANKPMNERQQVMFARCFAIIGQVERASNLWRALCKHTRLSDEHSQEFAILLCHMAVQANSKGDKRSAVLRLREAVGRVNKKTHQKNLEDIAFKLERQYAIQKILVKILPNMNTILEVPGRYYRFQQALENHPHHLRAILSTDDPPLEDLWNSFAYIHRRDIHFLHMLAITYREYMLAELAKQVHQEEYLTTNAILWTFLLCTDAFWHDFSHARITSNAEERENLSLSQQEQLFEEAIDRVLSLSITHASRAYTESRYNDAKIHLRCLYLCTQGAGMLHKTLLQYKYNLVFEVQLNPERLQKIMLSASDRLNQWCTRLLKEAEEAFGSLDILQEAGKNYEAAINKLMPFIDMRIPVKQVLATCLDWHNAWCYDEILQIINKSTSNEMFLTALYSASSIADQLIPLCSKGQGFLPENQTISQHLVWRGMSVSLPYDQEVALNFYREALAWDASNVNARKFVEDLQEEREDDATDEDEDDDEIKFDDDDYYDAYRYDGSEF